MNEKLEQARVLVAGLLDDILAVFKPGAKITVVVRRPGQPTQDFLMGDDDLDEVIALIQRRKTEDPV